MCRALILTALLTLPVVALAHEPHWLPPAPWGVNPCDLPRVRCPLALINIHDNLVLAQRRQDTTQERYWLDRLAGWYAYNPDYRHHLHPHR